MRGAVGVVVPGEQAQRRHDVASVGLPADVELTRAVVEEEIAGVVERFAVIWEQMGEQRPTQSVGSEHVAEPPEREGWDIRHRVDELGGLLGQPRLRLDLGRPHPSEAARARSNRCCVSASFRRLRGPATGARCRRPPGRFPRSIRV
jgi:hypothetical protein